MDPQFFTHSEQSLNELVEKALSEVRLAYSDIVPMVTTENEEEGHEVVRWDLQGQALVQYTDNTNIPELRFEPTQQTLELHEIAVQMEQTEVDKLRARQKRRLSLNEDVIRSALSIAIELRLASVLMKGRNDQEGGLLNLKGAVTVRGSLDSVEKMRKALLEARRELLKNRAKESGMFTVLMPSEYEDIIKGYPIVGSDITLKEILSRDYNLVISCSVDYPRIVMFQDTFGNLYFHRDKNIRIEERLSYENTSRKWFALITLVGLVVKNEKQVAYIDKSPAPSPEKDKIEPKSNSAPEKSPV